MGYQDIWKKIGQVRAKTGPRKKVGTIYGGELRLFLYSIFQDFGFKTIYVPKSQLNFKELAKYSSDEWCYTLKLFYYDLLKAINMGADVIVSLSTAFLNTFGPCKLPQVAEHTWEHLLKKMSKKNFQYLVFNFTPISFKFSMMKLVKRLGCFRWLGNVFKYKRYFKKAKLKLQMHDEIITLMRKIRAREEKKGESNKTYQSFLQKLEREQNPAKLNKLYTETKKKLRLIKIDKDKKPKKIAIIGDYATIIAEFPCFDLENFISDKFGIELFQPHTLYKYFFDKEYFKNKRLKKFEKKFKRYWVGGSDYITFKMIIRALDKKVDGIVHLRNFGCTPEQMIVEAVEQMKHQINFPPFISICFDEHANAEGIKTRIEAFCNTLLRSK